ncbi:MAG: hypothetical protein ACRC8A_13515 [Microcoleaceae cyanobacterium]
MKRERAVGILPAQASLDDYQNFGQISNSPADFVSDFMYKNAPSKTENRQKRLQISNSNIFRTGSGIIQAKQTQQKALRLLAQRCSRMKF